MKKAVLLVPVIALALTATAFAQAVDKGKDRAETVKISVSGSVDLDYVYRDSTIVEFRDAGAIGGVAVVDTGADGNTGIAADLRIRLDVELTDKCSVVLEMATNPTVDALGDDTNALFFYNAYLQLAEAIDPAITLRIGQVWTDFDVRGRGSSIVFDSFYSEAPSSDVVSEATSSVIDYAASAGVVLDYKREAISLQIGLLVAGNEGGVFAAVSEHLSSFYASFFYNLDTVSKGSRFGILAMILDTGFVGVGTGSPNNDSVITIGGGVDLFFMDNNALEVFAEVYMQFGGAGEAIVGVPPDEEELDAGGQAFSLGARYNFAGDSKPWVELKFQLFSGDDDAADSDQDAWISREHQRDLMILEDEVFGVDIDTNYTAIKISGGMSFTAGTGLPNNISLTGIVGIVTASEDIIVGPLATDGDDGIGNEIDVRLNWMYSKAVNITAGVAFLTGADVFDALRDPVDNEDSALLYTLGVNAKW